MTHVRDIHDHYFRQAKREGYRARAAYKLMEIDERHHVLREGDRVLDAGAAPGSWMQVAAERVGDRGVVVGVDRRPIEPFPNLPNAHPRLGDLREVDTADLLGPLGAGPDARFDVILSDLAPDTTGDRTIDHHGSVRLCQLMLDRAPDLLRPGGILVMKVFEGEAYPDLLARCRRQFDAVKAFKPKASRAASTEMYVIAKGLRGADPDAAAPEHLPPRRPPTGPGWGG